MGVFLAQGILLAPASNQGLDLNGVCKLLTFILACMLVRIASTITWLPAPKFSLIFLTLHCFWEAHSFAILPFLKCVHIFMKASYSYMGALEHLEFVTSLFLTNLFNTPAFISGSALKAWKDKMLGTALEIHKIKNV